MVGELFTQLVNSHKGVVVAIMIAEARNQQLVLDFVAEIFAALHPLRQGLLPGDMLLAVRVALHLHDQGAVLVTVLIEGVQLCYRVVKCLNRTAMRKNLAWSA